MPFLMTAFLTINAEKLHEQSFRNRVGTMYSGLELDNGKLPLMYNVIFVTRRLIFTFLIVFCSGLPFL